MIFNLSMFKLILGYKFHNWYPIRLTTINWDNIIWPVIMKKLTGSEDKSIISIPIMILNTAGQRLAI